MNMEDIIIYNSTFLLTGVSKTVIFGLSCTLIISLLLNVYFINLDGTEQIENLFRKDSIDHQVNKPTLKDASDSTNDKIKWESVKTILRHQKHAPKIVNKKIHEKQGKNVSRSTRPIHCSMLIYVTFLNVLIF